MLSNSMRVDEVADIENVDDEPQTRQTMPLGSVIKNSDLVASPLNPSNSHRALLQSSSTPVSKPIDNSVEIYKILYNKTQNEIQINNLSGSSSAKSSSAAASESPQKKASTTSSGKQKSSAVNQSEDEFA